MYVCACYLVFSAKIISSVIAKSGVVTWNASSFASSGFRRKAETLLETHFEVIIGQSSLFEPLKHFL